MGIRTNLARLTGKAAKQALRLKGSGGSSLPGKIALHLDPEFLSHVAQNYRVILVTGTNGKTLTTSLIVRILKEAGKDVLTNPTGANMLQGIASVFLSDTSRHAEKYCVLEVDEATMQYVTAHIKPEIIVFTNLFRDQMDRYGEIETTYQLMVTGAEKQPEALIIANGDAPMFASRALKNKIKFFGFAHEPDRDAEAPQNADSVLCPACDQVLRYQLNTYSNLGKYYCPKCAFARPSLTWAVNAIETLTLQDATFQIDGTTFHLPVAGIYNVYNALAAYAVATTLGIKQADIQKGFTNMQKVFGRQETCRIHDKSVMLNLIKNPVGFNQIVDLLALDETPFSLVVLLNDRPADGTDISWIWDGDFERLGSLADGRPLVLSGIRAKDLAVRFEVAGLKQDDIQIESDLSRLADRIQQLPTDQVYVLSTYTALLDLRKEWIAQGHIEVDG